MLPAPQILVKEARTSKGVDVRGVKEKVMADIGDMALGFLQEPQERDVISDIFDEDMYPSSCAKPDILDAFLQNSSMGLRGYSSHPHTSEYCAASTSNLDRERYLPNNYSPVANPPQQIEPNSQQPLTNQWEGVNVRDVDLQELTDVAEDLIKSEAQQQQQQQQQQHLIQHPVDVQAQLPHPQPQEMVQYGMSLQQVKQETQDYERQQQYSPYLDSSASENGFGCDQSPMRDDSVRKERRREQNRRAARKCREKKKRHQDVLVKSYEGLRGDNNRLKEEVEQLRQDMVALADLLRQHESTCPYAHTLPKVPTRYLATEAPPAAVKRQQQAGKYLQSR